MNRIEGNTKYLKEENIKRYTYWSGNYSTTQGETIAAPFAINVRAGYKLIMENIKCTLDSGVVLKVTPNLDSGFPDAWFVSDGEDFDLSTDVLMYTNSTGFDSIKKFYTAVVYPAIFGSLKAIWTIKFRLDKI